MREPRDAARPARSRRRSSTTRTRACSTATSRAAAFEAPLDDADRDDARRRGARARGARSRAPAHDRRLRLGRQGLPGGARRRCARRARTSFTVVDGDDRRAARPRRARARVLDGARGRGLPPPRRAVRSCARSTSRRARALVEPFSGDWYTQAKKETTTEIEEPLRAERRLGLELTFGRVSVTEQVVAYQRKRSATQATIELVAARPAADRASRPRRSGSSRRRGSSRASRRCRRCSARCTPPSTR